MRRPSGYFRFLLLALLAVAGCSRSSTDRTAETAADAPAAASDVFGSGSDAGATPAPPAEPENPAVVLAQRAARLTQEAGEHERRRYFDQAVAARTELVQLFTAQVGAEAWQTRTAQRALERTVRMKSLTPSQRAADEAAGAAEQTAYDAWRGGRSADALTSLAKAQGLAADVWGPESLTVASIIDQSARWQLALDRKDEAEPLFRRALDIRTKSLSPEHPDTIATMSGLGLLLQAVGRPQEAAPLLREAADRARAVWGESNLEYATHLNNLAMLLHKMGNSDEAIALLTSATSIRRQILSDRHQVVGYSVLNLGSVYYAAGRFDEAEPQFREAIAILEPTLGPGHAHTRQARANLAITRMAQRDFREAESLVRADLDWLRKTSGENEAEYAEGLARLAILYGNQGRFAEALPVAEQAAAIHRTVSTDADPRVAQAQDLVVRLRGRIDGRNPANAVSRAPQPPAGRQTADQIPAASPVGNAARTSFEQRQPR